MAPQNVASLRGYSYDDTALFRHNALPYGKLHPLKPKKKISSFTPSRNSRGNKAKVEFVIAQIVKKQIDITQEEPDWFRLACAFANEFGESGRGYFHAISQFYSNYDSGEADKKYDHALKGRYSSIGIGTFFKFAKNAL